MAAAGGVSDGSPQQQQQPQQQPPPHPTPSPTSLPLMYRALSRNFDAVREDCEANRRRMEDIQVIDEK